MVYVMSFEKFNYGSRIRKSLNTMVVKGVDKGHLLWRDRPFELTIYYTPLKKRIIDFILTGTDFKNLGINVSIGDDAQAIKEWAQKNGHQVAEIPGR